MDARQAARKRQKTRRNVAAFASLLATPATAGFRMPADGRLRLTGGATIKGASTRTLAGAATLDNVGGASVVTPVSGTKVYLDVGLGKWVKIAEGT